MHILFKGNFQKWTVHIDINTNWRWVQSNFDSQIWLKMPAARTTMQIVQLLEISVNLPDVCDDV
jgi:hypothetical protein